MNFIKALFVPAAFSVLAISTSMPAQAADPLCKHAKSQIGRDRCECNSDAGGAVRRDKVNKKIVWTRISAKAPQVHDCMMRRGHRVF